METIGKEGMRAWIVAGAVEMVTSDLFLDIVRRGLVEDRTNRIY